MPSLTANVRFAFPIPGPHGWSISGCVGVMANSSPVTNVYIEGAPSQPTVSKKKNDSGGFEIEMSKPPTQIVVVGAGHWRGEGMALVEAIR